MSLKKASFANSPASNTSCKEIGLLFVDQDWRDCTDFVELVVITDREHHLVHFSQKFDVVRSHIAQVYPSQL